ncbi:MAG: hypothetical protein ACRD19_12735 [Terriglobia bacterium]
MKELYEKFYERDGLKKVRDVLDGGDQAKVVDMVTSESSDFTDYLNFFEFLAYLLKSKQINREEVNGLFDYYLKNLKQEKNKDVAEYIAKPQNGFEQLQELLGAIKEE